MIIKDTKYINNKQGIVDADEYREMMISLDRIVSEALKYVDDYVAFLKCEKDKIDKEAFERRYKYTSLKYFHDILGI